MVFLDLNQDSEVSKEKQNSIAPVSDRVLAFFFDVVLFSPIFSLILSRLFKRVEFRYYTSPDSIEFLVLVGISILAVAVLTVLAQAAFLQLIGATPGKIFFKMKVISVSDTSSDFEQRLSFSQALLRSGLWVLEFFFLAIPFVEVLSQKQRRPLHDRAAETMVITLKQKSDGGPHYLETHFVRHLLFLVVLLFVSWGGIVVSQAYRMALRGDFKKEELEKEQYLCSSLGSGLEKDANRVDIALAKYMTGDIDERCLLSESDFAIWTANPEMISWAYLAKAFHFRNDKQKLSDYLQTTCDFGQKSEACQIAQMLKKDWTEAFQNGQASSDQFQFEKAENQRVVSNKNWDDFFKTSRSLTAKTLQLRHLDEQGKFTNALAELHDSERVNDFSRAYVEKETVKTLWKLNKKDQAYGAYLASWSLMPAFDKTELASWLCLEQLEEKCENREYPACRDLKNHIKSDQMQNINTDTVIALTIEKECKKSSEPVLVLFHKFIQNKAGLQKYLLAISSESPWGQERKNDELKRIVMGKDEARSLYIEKRALLSLSEKATSPAELSFVTNALQRQTVRNWDWLKIARNTIKKSLKANDFTVASQVAQMIPDSFSEGTELGKLRSIALTPNLDNQDRWPATENDKSKSKKVKSSANKKRDGL